MSRVYFHSPSGTAELRGSERAHLDFVARGPAKAAWGIDVHTDLDQLVAICEMIVEPPPGRYGANYLHQYMREAVAENTRNKAEYARTAGEPMGWQQARTSYDAHHRFRQSLSSALNAPPSNTIIRVAGVEVHAFNISLNTALAVGSEPIQLAAKIHGWCESHAWVDGPDRAWLANLMDEGLRVGVYRRGLWYADQPDGPRDKWFDQGWGQVQALLRGRDDEPVVMSYSAGDSFPNRDIAGWEPTIDPGWMPDWAVTDSRSEWDEMSAEKREDYRRDHAGDLWYDLPEAERWDLAMAGLKQRRPWAQLTPGSLGATTFGVGVTAYDLLAADRDDRVRVAAGQTGVVAA